MLKRARKGLGLSLGCLTLVVSLLLPAHAEDWDKTEIALFTTAITLDYVDYMQTAEIVGNDNYYETNPLLGKYPSESHVRNHFILSAVGSYLIADMLRPEYRKVFLIGFIIVESLCVNNNVRVGIRF